MISWSSEVDLSISKDHFFDKEFLESAKPHPKPEKYHPRRFAIPETLEIDRRLSPPMIAHPNKSASKKESEISSAEQIREVTAYNVGDPNQNYGDPCISANGENICVALEKGLRRCAANFVPFGTKLHIEEFGLCTVTDRMNKRYKSRVDIAMKLNEKEKALKFGLRKLNVQIISLN